ncbi:MAG: tripartite tricarboxylate transporter substrate binding protein [Acetobacteraceae bacterium]|nr:tripartite tricarboxylate transporter substrate binding protein [Acetobacteraceae bacterium]
MFGRRGFTLGSAAGLGALGSVAPAGRRAAAQQQQQQQQASGWPNRPLRWLVGYPPGGPSDTFARLTGAHIGTRLGQSVLVENRPGGGAVLASEAAARSAADGYTLLHVDNGILVYNPALYARLPYDPDRDLQGVGFIGRFPLFIVVRPDDPARDFADFLARSRVRAPNYGTPAVASPHHLAMEMVKRRTGLQANHVPYRGGPAAMQDLLAGQVDSVMIDCATGIPLIASGRVRALCALGETRSPRAPDVPTLRELGAGDVVAFGWQGMSVPAGVPAPVLDRLAEALRAAVAAEDVRARFETLGIESADWAPAEFDAFVRRENAAWRPLIRELGIRLDS